MVSRLVKQQNVSLAEHGTTQSKLHLPASREGGDGSLKHLISEAQVQQSGPHRVLRHLVSLQHRVIHNELNSVHLGLVTLDVVLNILGAHLLRAWETLDLAIGDSLHQGGLTTAVVAAETITLTTLEPHGGVVDKDHGTICKREVAVADILTLLIISDVHLLLGLVRCMCLLQENRHTLLGIGIRGHDAAHVRHHLLLPVTQLEVLGQDGVSAQGGNVVNVLLGTSGQEGGVVSLRAALNLNHGSGQLSNELSAQSGNRVWGTLFWLLATSSSKEGLVTTSSNTTALRIRHLVHGILQERQQLGDEGLGIHGILNQLAHVVNNDSRLTLDGNLGLTVEPTQQERSHNGQHRCLNLLHEGGTSQLVHALWDAINVNNAGNKGGDEGFNINVADNSAHGLHGGVSSSLHLSLHVNHDLRQLGNNIRKHGSHLLGGPLSELVKGGKSTNLCLPHRRVHASEKAWEALADTEGADHCNDGSGSLVGGSAGTCELVSLKSDSHVKVVQQVGLLCGSADGSKGLDEQSGTLTEELLLLVNGSSLDLVHDSGARNGSCTSTLHQLGKGSGRSCTLVTVEGGNELIDLGGINLTRGGGSSGGHFRKMEKFGQ
mmetsp:Transcript_42170/g.51201  ORF Transcript_42170/g.51201 Transcript_42170/m.51201 type:complete len:604 (-) Transcript_42170:85-1896(-)